MMTKTLRQWRNEKLLSIDALSEKAGVSNKTVVQLEHGRQVPRPVTMRKLCAALDVQPMEIAEFRDAIEAASESPHSD